MQPRIELASIVMNQLFMLIGISFFDWTMVELLLFYWIEPIVYILLTAYLRAYLPIQLAGYKGVVAKFNNQFFGIWLAQCLFVAAASAGFFYWILSQYQSVEKPIKIGWDWVLLIFFFVLILAMPVFMQVFNGFLPSEKALPIQTRVLLHPLQLFTTYSILGATLLISHFGGGFWLVVSTLLFSKLCIEILLYIRIHRLQA
jgi:hypothetical protein